MSDRIYKELKKQYEELSKKYQVFGVFLYGSQNYGVDTSQSDIDTKAVVIPTLDDLIFCHPISKTIKTDVGECYVKDIRVMMAMFRKQNVNFLEILFTDYYYISPKYRNHFVRLRNMGEDIARYNEKYAAACILGIFNNEHRRLFREDDEDVQIHGYRRKSYCNINRLCDTMQKYCGCKRLGYKYCISSPEYKNLKTRVLPKEMVKSNAEIIKGNIEKIYHEFEPKEKNPLLDVVLDNWSREVIVEANGIIVCRESC